MRRVLLGLFMAIGFIQLDAAAERRAMSPVDMVELHQLSAPALSPDGTKLAYLRSETLWADNKIVDRLVLLDLETGESLPTPSFGDASDPASPIWWAPDSQSFIFLREADDPKKIQAYLYNLESQEVRQLTRHRERVFEIFWRPDGAGFYFLAAEQPPAEDSALLDGNWIIAPFESNADREIWYFDLNENTSSPVLRGHYSIRQVSLSQDGQFLTHSRLPDHRLDALAQGEVYVHVPETGDAKRLTTNQHIETVPQLSPDLEQLAYIATVNARGEPYYEPKVFVTRPDKPTLRVLADEGMEALDFAWDATGDGVFILGNTGVRSNLYHYALETGTLRQITEGDHNVRDWVYYPDTDTHVARFERADSPGEFEIMTSEQDGFQTVSQEYSGWSERFDLPKQEKVSWRGRGRTTIEGVLVYPVEYEPGQTYPLVTLIHGGPRASSRFGNWHVTRYLSVLAGQGYMILLPNHRGGTGNGDRFLRDMFGGYFDNAHHDVMDGVDAMIDRGLADPDRLIVMGWSAGGHMVNKLITHTDRFGAASSGAGASDWLSMHGESDVRHGRQFIFGGVPWQRNAPRGQYTKDSPLKDVWKVTTPTLFFVGENDVRVPPTQSILMYRGVRATGTPTVLFQAEDEPHNFQKPSNQLFKINTELGWFAQFAGGERYDPDLPEEAKRRSSDPLEPEPIASP